MELILMDKLDALITEHEGLRLFCYTCPSGKVSIGVGRNLTDRGIRHDEAMLMLANDIAESRSELSHYDWYNNLDDVRKGVMVELHFNIGLTSLLKFRQMIGAIEKKEYLIAAMHMLNSKWATQVGFHRSHNMANRLKSGKY